jgi:hypothetical protein
MTRRQHLGEFLRTVGADPKKDVDAVMIGARGQLGSLQPDIAS